MIAAGLLLATLATSDRCLGAHEELRSRIALRGERKNRVVAACYSSPSRRGEGQAEGSLRPHKSLNAPGPVPPATRDRSRSL